MGDFTAIYAYLSSSHALHSASETIEAVIGTRKQ
jgi:hypothetical protein